MPGALRERWAVMAGTIKNVVFDMGNVLMRFDGLQLAQAFTATPEDAALLRDALFGAPIWVLLDSGTVTHETVERVAAAHLPERLRPNLHECMANWAEHSLPIEGTNDLAVRLKKAGYGIYLLSNTSTHVDDQLKNMPAAPYLDGRVISAAERLMKPDPAIYQLLCERYGLVPGECLFVDDLEDNCVGARVAGMQAVRFAGDVAALEAAVREVGLFALI